MVRQSIKPRRKTTHAAAKSSTTTATASRKRIILFALLALLVIIAALFVYDIASNFGKIHKGVVVQGVDVGGLTKEEAGEVLDTKLTATVNSSSVLLFADEVAQYLGEDVLTQDITSGATAYDPEAETEDASSWRLSATAVGADVDGAALAEQAYQVSRGKDFLSGRLKTAFGGEVELEATLNFDPTHIEGVRTLLSKNLGNDMVNASVSYDGGTFVAADGTIGYAVESNSFSNLLSKAFYGTQRELIIPMANVPMDIDLTEATTFAQYLQNSIAAPITLNYQDGQSWELDSTSLGYWIENSVEGSGAEARLVPWVNIEEVEDGINEIIGDYDVGVKPEDARFEMVADKVQVVPGKNGSGIDYNDVANNLHTILFPAEGQAPERKINVVISELEPEFTTQMAKDMNIKDKIATYSTEYTGSSNNKIINLELAADLLNNSVIAPGGVWSFHETAGECNAEAGFQQATSIVEGEYVDEIGGGICQVATTVFNAVFESGLPIVERVNHGFYLIAYPAGRDATVSWTWPDLKFENDTENHILLTMSHDGSFLTCTLWGTDPGYSVEFSDTGFTDRTDYTTKEVVNPDLPEGQTRTKQTGVQGRTIVVTRTVYNAAGEVLRETSFKSVYEPETEIIEVGSKPAEATEDS